MSNDLFQHFGNVQDNSDMYWHGFGLKPTAKYKQRFWVKKGQVLSFFDKNGQQVNTVNVSSDSLNSRMVFSPSANRCVLVVHNSTQMATIAIIEASSGILITTITEVSTGSVDVDIDKQGNIYVLNKYQSILKKYDKNGVLLQTNTIPNHNNNHNGGVFYNQKRKLLWIIRGSSTTNGFYDENLNRLFDAPVPASGGQAQAEFLTNDRIAYMSSSGSSLTVRQYDFSDINNIQLLSSTTLEMRPEGNDWNATYLGQIKDRIYTTSTTSSSSRRAVVYFDKDLTKHIFEFPTNSKIIAIDDKYCYVKVGSNLQIYLTSDFSLFTTIPSSIDVTSSTSIIMGNTRGREVNFSDYVY